MAKAWWPIVREFPARKVGVPDTVSPQMQALIAQPLAPDFTRAPATDTEWRTRIAEAASRTIAALPALRQQLRVEVTPTMVAGVACFSVRPAVVPERNRHRLLLHLHGGVRVLNPGEAGTREAILMAGFAGFAVLSVDYRMPPDFPFPAALDDAVAVYREVTKMRPPACVGVFGCSAGGGLACSMLLRAKAAGLGMPGAMALGTPTVDLTDAGDSLYTNEGVDNVLGMREGFVKATVALYADGRDPSDPLLSPIYGDVSGFPPAILTSGTRDLYLSNTVRMHRKLRGAGVLAQLQVWEGQSHAQYMADPTAPETMEYHDEVAAFFDTHLR